MTFYLFKDVLICRFWFSRIVVIYKWTVKDWNRKIIIANEVTNLHRELFWFYAVLKLNINKATNLNRTYFLQKKLCHWNFVKNFWEPSLKILLPTYFNVPRRGIVFYILVFVDCKVFYYSVSRVVKSIKYKYFNSAFRRIYFEEIFHLNDE